MKKIVLLIMLLSVCVCGCGSRDVQSVKIIEKDPVSEETFEDVDVETSDDAVEKSTESVDYASGDVSDDASDDVSDEKINEPDLGAEEVMAERKNYTVKNLLKAALEPVGSCLYVYGGAWNEEDTAAGIEAMTIGVSPRWKEYFNLNDSSYNYKNTRYQIHDGLDCTGLIGYAVYQVFENEYSDNGYVFTSKTMASEYANLFDGTMYYPGGVSNYEPGDIMAGGSGHAFIIIGQCDDGSILFAHASPPCVTLSGSATPSGEENSQAYQLAHKYMEEYYPESHHRYENCSRGTGYLTDYNQMRWNPEVLTDPDGYRNMSPEDIMLDLFF